MSLKLSSALHSYLSQVVGNEVLLVTVLAPKHHDTLHEGHPVDLRRARRIMGRGRQQRGWGAQKTEGRGKSV